MNDRVRVEPGEDGTLVVMGAWCGKCGREVLPVGEGDCPWCGSRILDESQLSARAMVAQIRNGHGPGRLEEAEQGGAASEPSASSSPTGFGRPPKWTLERCIAAVREVAEKVGHTPSRTEMKKHGYVSVTVSSTTLARLEMTWEDLLREAGFDPDDRDTGRAAALAPTSPEGNTAARPAEPEREPQDGHLPDPRSDTAASSLVLAAEGATSRSAISQILELLRLIELLDADPCDCDRGRRYARVLVWKEGSGDDDEEAQALFRRLLCQELISHAPEDIATAVLSRLEAFEEGSA